jgi:hypothetical protein
LVHINFDERDSSLLMFLVDIGSNIFAGSAPLGMAINHSDSSVAIQEALNFF